MGGLRWGRHDRPHEARRADGRELAERIKTLIGITVDGDLRPDGALLRSQGDANRVIDLRQPARALLADRRRPAPPGFDNLTSG